MANFVVYGPELTIHAKKVVLPCFYGVSPVLLVNSYRCVLPWQLEVYVAIFFVVNFIGFFATHLEVYVAMMATFVVSFCPIYMKNVCHGNYIFV